MPNDIRSYFHKSPKAPPNKNNIKPSANSSTEGIDANEEIPETPTITNKVKNKKRQRIISDDEDSGTEFTAPKTKKPELSKSSEKNNSKIVNPRDIFGTTPVKRSKTKDVKKNGNERLKTSEADIHNDKNFSKTLIELKKSPSKSKSPSKESHKTNNITKSISLTPKKNESKISPKNNRKIHAEDGKNNSHSNGSRKDCDKNSTVISKSDISVISPKNTKNQIPPIENFNSPEDTKSPKKVSPDSQLATPKSAKRQKAAKILETPELTDEERHERRRYGAQAYKNYLNRSGPKNLGSKKVPDGSPNCLVDHAFVITGVLDSFEKDDIIDIIKKFGGEVKTGISKKVTHVLYGEEPGVKKINKAKELGLSILTEDEFLNLIVTNSKNENKPANTDKSKDEKKSKKPTSIDQKGIKRPISNDKADSDNFIKNKKPRTTPKKEKLIDVFEEEIFNKDIQDIKTESSIIENNIKNNNLSWVEKYRPNTVKQIIGQHGESSCAAKLTHWLSKWYQNRLIKIPAPSPWSKGDGGYFKAVLLSGSPGIGKTTTVSVVCKELGFDMIEFNASDTRSKTLIKEQISGLTTTNTLSGYIHGKKKVTKKHVVIMDEVDGMAGNEDRGGMQELLSLIKNTEIPIICICNDKTSPKMRSLTNHCFELAFIKPKLEQIKAAMRSICFKEGIKISSDTLDELIKGTSQDIRQTLNMLSVWSVENKDLTGGSDKSKDIRKDIKMGPWSVLRMVFSEEDHKKMNIHEKSSLFFHDYSLAPLFVQHNYLKVVPHCPKSEILDRFASAADSLSAGDLVETKIRRGMAWNLLPVQAMFSSVIPGAVLSGHSSDKIDFPAWLGQNSRANKMNRLIQELHSHMRLSTSGSKQSIRLDYANHIRDAVLQPLIVDGGDGVQKAVDTLQAYHLLREDLDSLLDFTTWSGMKDKSVLVNSKVKAAMTKKYNKEATPLPYSHVNIKKGQSGIKYEESGELADADEQETIEDNNEDSDVENDAMVKKLNKPTTRQPTKSRATSKTTKAETKTKRK